MVEGEQGGRGSRGRRAERGKRKEWKGKGGKGWTGKGRGWKDKPVVYVPTNLKSWMCLGFID